MYRCQDLDRQYGHWRGFVDGLVGPALERLARYILRPPVNLERMGWDGGAEDVAHTLKPKSGEMSGEEHLDPLGFLARVLAHVLEPKLHTLRYYVARRVM